MVQPLSREPAVSAGNSPSSGCRAIDTAGEFSDHPVTQFMANISSHGSCPCGAVQFTTLACHLTRRVICCCMIQSFSCRDTQALYEGKSPRRFRAFISVVERKLSLLDAAQTLAFLNAPPGNRLEALKDDRKGQHSIRINDQWRICFVWTDVGPAKVEIVDYH